MSSVQNQPLVLARLAFIGFLAWLFWMTALPESQSGSSLDPASTPLDPLSTSDWIYTVGVLVLGAAAMVGPYVAEVIKRWKFAPQLSVDFELDAPFCHKTRWRPRPGTNVDYDEPAYYCRFRVKNTGKTQARDCEAFLEEIWIYDSSDRPLPFPNFSAVHLKWVGSQSKFENINPDRRSVYCDIGYVSSRTYQDRYETRELIDVPGHGGNDLRFVLELSQVFYSQPSCLVPGKYALGIALYAENAASVRLFLEVSWSGQWRDTEPEMFRELVIRTVSDPSTRV